MKRLTTCLAGICIIFLHAQITLAQAKENLAVYVWDFTDRMLEKNALTGEFTHEFETALSQNDRYRVLERREIGRLISQAENEKKIATITDLSSSTIDILRAQKADMVIFGEVYDDVNSGQVSVTVTFEDFTGQKKLIKSILIPRGVINDAATRASAMGNLVSEIIAKTATVQKKEMLGLIFEIQKCAKTDKAVSIEFLVTNNQDDREVTIDGSCNVTSWLFDDAGNQTTARTVRIANRTDCSVRYTLISGLPTKCQMYFDGVSSKAKSISRLDINYSDSVDNGRHTLTFRNLELVQ